MYLDFIKKGTREMNANELADELERPNNWQQENNFTTRAATMLRQLQKERDLLFTAHSHEMVRADELQIECDRLYRIIELNGKIE
jgi:uncharacterized tellurite resistance protein B-like protein